MTESKTMKIRLTEGDIHKNVELADMKQYEGKRFKVITKPTNEWPITTLECVNENTETLKFTHVEINPNSYTFVELILEPPQPKLNSTEGACK
jgi:hypothetical protein